MTAPSWRMSWMRLQNQLMRGRKAKGWSQEELAARLGVGRRTIQRWEEGRVEVPGMELFRWAAALGIEIHSTAQDDGATCGAREAA